MQADPLQQLRDIHLPADPSWWPPAPGWWLLLLVVIALIGYLSAQAINAWRRRAPIRTARRLLAQAEKAHQAGDLSAIDYSHEINALLKRVLVRALGYTHLAKESGDKWLMALDDIGQCTDFTQGPGRMLGPERYAANASPDVTQINAAVAALLGKLERRPDRGRQ